MTNKEKLTEAVLEQAKMDGDEKRITCAEAFELAKKLNVGVFEVGRICNCNNIKIRKCQLGCFT